MKISRQRISIPIGGFGIAILYGLPQRDRIYPGLSDCGNRVCERSRARSRCGRSRRNQLILDLVGAETQRKDRQESREEIQF
jgi:hypothetical protein